MHDLFGTAICMAVIVGLHWLMRLGQQGPLPLDNPLMDVALIILAMTITALATTSWGWTIAAGVVTASLVTITRVRGRSREYPE